MAELDKRATTHQGVLEELIDNMALPAGGFGLCGIPENLITEVRRREVQGLTVVFNNRSVDGFGLGVLLETRQVRRVVAPYVREDALSEKQVFSGELEAILTSQGTLAEQLRVDDAGIPALSIATGYGASVTEGKEVYKFAGRPCILEQVITGDFALVKGRKADWCGNVIYCHTAQNFDPLMAAAGRITVVEAEEIVPPGKLDPAVIHTPGIFVSRTIRGQLEKCIEQRTLRQKEA